MLNKLKVILVFHDYPTGSPHALGGYLRDAHVNSLITIGHVNRYAPKNPITASHMEMYKGKKTVRRIEAPKLTLPEYLQYIKDTVYTFVWTTVNAKGTYDYFIGVGNLNAFCGLILRSLGLVKHVIFYSIDYLPKRFENVIFNSIYHFADYLSVSYSDYTWNYAIGMIRERKRKWGKSFPGQLIVPHGVTIHRKTPILYRESNKYELVYMGNIYKTKGIQLVIKALPIIKKTIPDISLTVIGGGDYIKDLTSLASSLGIAKSVHFTGYIADTKKIEYIVSRAALGTAMYDPSHEFISYTEPAKVKQYLSSGIPVIMTDTSAIAGDVIRYGCGIVSPYDSKKFAENVLEFFSGSDEDMNVFRENAFRYAKKYTWETVFTHAFKKSGVL